MSRGRQTAAIILGLVVVVLLASALGAGRPSGVSGPPAALAAAPEVRLAGGILDGQEYTQALDGVGNSLSEVGLYVDPGGRRAFAPLHLTLSSGGHAVREAVGTYRPPDDTVRFAFAPIPLASSLDLTMRLAAPGATPATMLTLFVVQGPPAGTPHLAVDGRDTGSYLPVRARYGGPLALVDQLTATSDRASQYHPSPLKTPVPLVLAVLALVASLGLVPWVAGVGGGGPTPGRAG
jgi:hypothetical protein